MNQYKGPQFDLGMRGHLESFAELNIEASLVGRTALWQALEPCGGEFNPTTWTPMPALLAAGRGLAAKVATEGIDFPIMPLLGLDAAALAELSDTAFGFVSQNAQTADELAAITLRDFVEHSLDEGVAACLSEKGHSVLSSFAAFRLGEVAGSRCSSSDGRTHRRRSSSGSTAFHDRSGQGGCGRSNELGEGGRITPRGAAVGRA